MVAAIAVDDPAGRAEREPQRGVLAEVREARDGRLRARHLALHAQEAVDVEIDDRDAAPDRSGHQTRAPGPARRGLGDGWDGDRIARRLWGKLPVVRLMLVANPGSGRDTDLTALAAALRERGAEVEAFDIDELGDAARAVGATDRSSSPAATARSAPRRWRPRVQASRWRLCRPARRTTSPARSTSPPTGGGARPGRDPVAPTSRVELLIAGGRPFVNAASTGLAVAAAHRARPLKSRLGPLAYAIGGLRAGSQHARCRSR